MATTKIVPMCRYEHGRMERQEGLWGLDQIRMAPADAPAAKTSLATGISFVASMYRCSVCGYLELIDDEEAA